MTIPDTAQRFLFENTDIRGERVGLSSSLQAAFEPHAYPSAIRRLLGEMAAAGRLAEHDPEVPGHHEPAGALERAGFRTDGSNAPISAPSAPSPGGKEEPADDVGLQALLPDGQLVITVDPVKGKRYQGIVPLEKSSTG